MSVHRLSSECKFFFVPSSTTRWSFFKTASSSTITFESVVSVSRFITSIPLPLTVSRSVIPFSPMVTVSSVTPVSVSISLAVAVAFVLIISTMSTFRVSVFAFVISVSVALVATSYYGSKYYDDSKRRYRRTVVGAVSVFSVGRGSLLEGIYKQTAQSQSAHGELVNPTPDHTYRILRPWWRFFSPKYAVETESRYCVFNSRNAFAVAQATTWRSPPPASENSGVFTMWHYPSSSFHKCTIIV